MRILETLALASAFYAASAIQVAGQEIIPTPETTNAALASCTALAFCVMAMAMRTYCRKVGGLTFMRLGRFQFSFCITK